MHILSSFGRAYDTPTLLGSVEEWHDASDSTDSALMTVSTGDCTNWKNLATGGSGADLTPGTAPAVATSTQGGLDGLSFDDGNTEYLTHNSPWIYDAAGSTGATLYLVVKSDGDLNCRLLNEARAASATPLYNVLRGYVSGDSAGHLIRNDAGTTHLNNGLGFDAHDDAWHIVTITDSGSQVIGYLDGVAGSTRNYSRSGAFTLDTFSLGAVVYASTVINPAEMTIGEFSGFSEVHTPLQRNLEIGRLAHKWSLTGNLAAGHPFKSFPPSLH